MNSLERLIYMANQIAANLALSDDPVAATADHIAAFWDPRMKRMIFEAYDAGTLDGTVAAAIRMLRDCSKPTLQWRASVSAGGPDAG